MTLLLKIVAIWFLVELAVLILMWIGDRIIDAMHEHDARQRARGYLAAEREALQLDALYALPAREPGTPA